MSLPNGIVNKDTPSLAEWFEIMNQTNSEDFRIEDNTRRNRLEILYNTIGIQYERPEKMTARDIVDKTPIFLDVLNRKGDEQCAIRLIPNSPELPKLRVRGKTFRENLIWFHEQKIDPDNYKVEVLPHSDETLYSSIFVINDHGAWGEIVPGGHIQLTQGPMKEESITFFFDFSNWQFSEPRPVIQNLAKQVVANLLVPEELTRGELKEKLNATFTSSGHLKGYFEFVLVPNQPVTFIDYNRILLEKLKDAKPVINNSNQALKGVSASLGIAKGKVKIVLDPHNTNFENGNILVCPMTTIDYVPLMKKASAIITDHGNILCHAAIVSRELEIPCIVATKNATTLLKNGDLVEIDADKGEIKVIKN